MHVEKHSRYIQHARDKLVIYTKFQSAVENYHCYGHAALNLQGFSLYTFANFNVHYAAESDILMVKPW